MVAYELLCRRKPFDGQSYSDVLEKIQTFDPTNVGIVNPLISPELEIVVERCLDKMRSVGCRHLPVVADGRVIAMISMRDLMRDEIEEQVEEIRGLRAYIHQA